MGGAYQVYINSFSSEKLYPARGFAIIPTFPANFPSQMSRTHSIVLVDLCSCLELSPSIYSSPLILQHASVHVAQYTPRSSHGTTILQFPSCILVNTLVLQPHNTPKSILHSIVLFKHVDE